MSWGDANFIPVPPVKIDRATLTMKALHGINPSLLT